MLYRIRTVWFNFVLLVSAGPNFQLDCRIIMSSRSFVYNTLQDVHAKNEFSKTEYSVPGFKKSVTQKFSF